MRSECDAEKPEPSNAARLVSEGRATLQERIQTGTIVIIVKKGVHNTAGTKKVLLKTRAGCGAGGGGGVPELPASDDQSVHQPGLAGAAETAALAELKNSHPGKVLFLPPDGE